MKFKCIIKWDLNYKMYQCMNVYFGFGLQNYKNFFIFANFICINRDFCVSLHQIS